MTPEFCLGQVTYNCLSVEGPSGFGGTKFYEGIDYPVKLCSSIDSANGDFVATFTAGAINYKVLLDQFNMPPGEYTFTYEARSPDVSQITTVAITNTVTWTLIDPCANQQITLSPFTTFFTYTLNDVAITDIALPEVEAVPGLTFNRRLENFCTVSYSLNTGNPQSRSLCIQNVSFSAPYTFDIFCDKTSIAPLLGTIT